MKIYKYKDATIYIRGDVDRDTLEEATIKFMKKAYKCRKNKTKEKIQNDNENKTRAVG